MTSFQLRTSPSGVLVEGVNQNDVLLWDVATKRWVPGEVSLPPLEEIEIEQTSGAIEIDFSASPLQLLNLDGAATLTVIPPSSARHCQLRVVTTGAPTLGLPAGTKVAGGPYTPTVDGEDILTWYFKGSTPWRVAAAKAFIG